METFSEAKPKFGNFLKEMNHPDNIIWIFQEDIRVIGSMIFYRVSDKTANEKYVEQLYQTGIKRDFGITLTTVFYSKENTFAYIWLPTSDLEAEQHLQCKGLKLSATVVAKEPSLFKEIEITNSLKWQFIKIFGKMKPKDIIQIMWIPSKVNL